MIPDGPRQKLRPDLDSTDQTASGNACENIATQKVGNLTPSSAHIMLMPIGPNILSKSKK